MKRHLLLFLTALLLLPAAMKAQNSTVTVGVGTTSYNLMPVNTSYNYGLTEQIYTAAEIGQSGTIYSLAFYNSSESVTRNIDIYMVNTDKSSFSDGYDWVTVSSSDLVFSGEVDLVNDMWSTIELTQPFYYSGSGNLLIAVNDNTGNTTSSILFFSVFNAPGQAICATSDDVNCNPFSPGIYGYVVDYKNPIQLGFEPVVCHKPTNLALSDVGENSAVLNWEQPGGGDHWYVQYTTNEYFYFFYEEHVSSTSVTLHNLHPNRTYYVRVANECDSSSISPWCISPSFITTESACPTPSNFTATNVSSTYVNLTWNQPDGGNTWLVEFNTNPSFSSSSATVVHDTSMLLTNLTPNTTYYVHVRNYCDNLNSSHWSNTVSFTTTDETSTCLAPTDLYAFNISANGASIMWNQPDVGANWMVQYSTNADFSNADEITITTRGWYLNGIDPSTHYYVRVAQVCSSSISPWCETAEFTTPASPCATPTGLTVSNISYNGADLNWILTGSSGSCEIEYSTNPDFTSSTTVNTGTTSFSLTNLDPITTYYVRVRLFCGIVAHGSWSNTVSFTTTGGYIACLPPINLTVLNIGSDGAGVSWEQPGDGEQWMIQYSTNADFSNANELTIGGTSWYLNSLEPGTHYYVRVAQVCTFPDMSSWSETEEFTTIGGGNAETEIIDFETATLSEFPFDNDPTYLWSITEAPNDCNNCGNYCMHSGNYGWDNTTSMISATYDFSDDGYISFDAKCAGEATNYDVCEFYIDGNMQFFRDVASWENYMYTVSAGTHTFTWLFRKDQSVSNTGEGFYVDNIVFGVTSPAVCLAPTDLEYSNVSYNGADLTWSQPGDGNEWQIEYSTDPDFTSSEFVSSGATYFPLTVLYPITTYYVRVRHLCGTMDPSAWSNTVSFTTTGGIIIIPDIIDFETGDFFQYPFDQDDAYPWIIVDAATPNGCDNGSAYCMRSGNAGIDNTTSSIEASYYFSEDGYIIFDAKCMGEASHYDVCQFYIDGVQQFSIDVADWNHYIYAVSAGTHTFTWSYSKDGSVSDLGDGFFVDNIVFELNSTPLCATPGNFEVFNVGSNGAGMSWNQPGGGDQWIVQYSTNADFSNSTEIVSYNTDMYLLSLTPETTYYVRVANNCGSLGYSLWSETKTFTTTESPCLAPDEANVYIIGQDYAYLSWVGPDGGYEWEYEYSTSPDFSSSSVFSGIVTETTVVELTGLTPQTTYYARVRHFCGTIGFSEWTETVSFTTFAPCPAPDEANVYIIGQDYAYLSWVGPEGGYEWEYEYSTSPDFSSNTVSGSVTETTVVELTGLTPQTTYYARVRHFCGTMGLSEWTETVSFTTFAPCPAPDEANVYIIGQDYAYLSWVGPDGGYEWEYQYSTSPDFSSNTVSGSVTETTVVELTGLTPQTTYYARVRHFCGTMGSSEWTETVSFTTFAPCPAPDEANVFTVGQDYAYLSWFGPDGGYEWEYEYSTSPDFSSNTVSGSVTETTVVELTGLTPQTTYYARVRHFCGTMGSSEWTETVSFTTFAPCPAPDEANVFTVGQDYAYLSWFGPDGGYEWEYEYSTSPDFSSNTVSGSVTETTVVELTGLTPQTTYYARVRHFCGTMGSSEWTETVSFTTTVHHIVPTYVTINGETSVCPKKMTTLIATSDVDGRFLWSTDEEGPQIIVTAGTYSVTVTSPTGDWIADTITVTEKEIYKIDIDSTICYNELPIVWNGITFTSAGEGTVTLEATSGCDSTVIMHLIVNPIYTISETRTICPNALPYNWNGVTFTETGTQNVTLQSVSGCDSVVVMTVLVNTAYTVSENRSICPNGLPYSWNGVTFTEAGTKNVKLQASNGCDSIVTMTLTVNPTYNTPIEATICQGTSYNFFGQPLQYAGEYTHTLYTANGCDSVITLTLTVNPAYSTAVSDTICEGERYDFFGQTLTQAGEYIHQAQTVNGCDSVVSLNLIVNHPVHTAVIETACNSYTWNGTTFTTTGTYTYSHPDANGCTQVDTLHLTVNYSNTGVDVQTACESYTWIDGQTYTASTNTPTFTLTNAAGCDSVVTLHLTVNHPVHTAMTETACNSYVWNNNTYTESGTYTYSHPDANGCTQVDTLHLSVNYSNTGVDVQTACESYTWIDGQTYTASTNTPTFTLTNAAGCDSVVTLHLTIHPTYNTLVSADICQGGSYDFFGQALTQTGTYTHTLQTVHGCDSVITLSLTVHTMMLTQIADTICEGTSYPFFDQTLTLSGVYAHTLQTVYGCDSVITLALTVLPASHTDLTAESCSSYEWNGVTYTQSGDYSVNYTAANGCDSIVTLHLTILPVQNTAVSADICQGGSYDFFGQALTQTGTYTHTLTSANGCDSVITLSLTVHSMMLTQIADTICEGTSYPFFDQTLTQTGVYAHALQTVYGCDSVITLALTVLPASHTDLSAEGCDSYEWNGETYTQSGNYSVSYTAANGCDSIVTLHLTISHSVTSEFTIETNEGCYTWNGTEYCQSGDYTQTLQTVAGCDSVVTLHLTVGVGIEDHDLNAAIFLTPNPATNICRINGLETDPVSVDLYDMNGKLVRRPNTTEFDVSTLPTGIYMVRVTTDDNRIVNLKMVKQ